LLYSQSVFRFGPETLVFLWRVDSIEPHFDLLATTQDSHGVAVRDTDDLALKVIRQRENQRGE